MQIKKRIKYIESLYGAIHTLSGKAQQVNFDVVGEVPTIKKCHRQQNKNKEYIYLQLNPNKVIQGSMLKRYSDFDNVLTSTLQYIEAKEFEITRADMSFNSDNQNDYELFKKLNRLLICCISEAYVIRNCYQTYDLWTYKSLSVAIKSDTFEAENYDKEQESHGLVETTNRLELRSKRMNGSSLENEFICKWFNRLDKALGQFEAVQKHYNCELVKLWYKDIAKPKKDRDFLSMNAFILQFKDCIFTRKQLEELYRQLGAENYISKARNFKSRHKIEFYSFTDLKIVIKAIKQKTKEYFDS